MSGPTNLHLAWARLFVRAAASAGVTEVVLSPGSRSTPLAIAAATEPRVRLHVIVDERSAAFFALGQARVTGRPTMLVCTSGTAGAHYFPAVIEAHQSFAPLLAVTADRPWELADAAAPQTIDQLKLFGGFVRHFAELGLPCALPSALRAVPRVAAQAVARALGPTPGPVHVNARFRKPLEPVAASGPEPWEPLWEALMARGAPAAFAPASAPSEEAVAALADRAARAERGLIVCGPAPLVQADGPRAVLALARRTGFALLAEGTSQIRFGGDRGGVIDCSAFDAVLRVPGFRARCAPDLILELGAPPTSAGYAALLAEHPGTPRFVIAPHGWNDPQGDASALVLADPAEVARRVTERLPVRTSPSPWAAGLAHAGARAEAIVARALAGDDLSEPAVARAVVAACPEGSLLAIGNSTPVRDLDLACPASPRALRVLHQRGASGIDGLVSGAAGSQVAAGAPVVLLLGDLSLLHDLGGLATAAKAGGPLVVVVVQNGGGRIFEQLPIAGRVDDDLFDRCFTTPEAVRFEQAAAAFGIPYARATTQGALAATLAAALARAGATLIEAVVPPREGARLAARIHADLAAALAAAP
jgi:2-succinyl-5-enolpyruvyl-6-hydroxy-3-cyclohexene-1-carboxylate synthase